MSFVTAGLPGLGLTRHFHVSYDSASPLDGREAAIALQSMCTDDYELMSNWFRGVSIEPVDIKISTVPEGWEPEVMGHFLMTSGPGVSLLGGVTIEPGPKPSPARIRYMFVEEVTKLFMLAQDRGWIDADGKGHGLSLARFLGAQALAANGMGAPDLDLQSANSWMQTTRRDFVNGPGDGGVPDGCRALFLYYLVMQLKFSVDQIVGSGGPTVADAYRALTHKDEDPFPEFKALLDSRYPGTATIPDHPDNPWPIGHLAEALH